MSKRITAGDLQAVTGAVGPCCKKYLREYKGRLGMGRCPCKRQWYHFAPGWAKKWGTDRVYHDAAYVGTWDKYGDLRRMMKAAR
jgi:hypothetical protein